MQPLIFQIVLSGRAAFGSSIARKDKSILKNDFDISIKSFEMKRVIMGSLVWSPIYGKFQMGPGGLCIADTFFNVGAGVIEGDYVFENCVKSESYPHWRLVWGSVIL